MNSSTLRAFHVVCTLEKKIKQTLRMLNKYSCKFSEAKEYYSTIRTEKKMKIRQLDF